MQRLKLEAHEFNSWAERVPLRKNVLFCSRNNDGSEVMVAIKSCKEDARDNRSMTESLLDEARELFVNESYDRHESSVIHNDELTTILYNSL